MIHVEDMEIKSSTVLVSPDSLSTLMLQYSENRIENIEIEMLFKT